MNQIEDKNRMLRVVVLISTTIFSLVAMILVFSEDFGGWWTGASNYYYWLGSEIAPGWSKIFLVLLGLIFLMILAYSVLLIVVELLKKKLKLSYKLQAIIGIVLGVFAFIFTGLTVGMFAIFASEGDWWLETSFYSSLVGAILVVIFYVIYLIIPTKESTSSS
jgi:hypothetical protein